MRQLSRKIEWLEVVVHQLCDKDRLTVVCFDEFLKKNQIYSFNEKLFCVLAEHGINQSNFFNHKIAQLVIDELEAFYNILPND